MDAGLGLRDVCMCGGGRGGKSRAEKAGRTQEREEDLKCRRHIKLYGVVLCSVVV